MCEDDVAVSGSLPEAALLLESTWYCWWSGWAWSARTHAHSAHTHASHAPSMSEEREGGSHTPLPQQHHVTQQTPVCHSGVQIRGWIWLRIRSKTGDDVTSYLWWRCEQIVYVTDQSLRTWWEQLTWKRLFDRFRVGQPPSFTRSLRSVHRSDAHSWSRASLPRCCNRTHRANGSACAAFTGPREAPHSQIRNTSWLLSFRYLDFLTVASFKQSKQTEYVDFYSLNKSVRYCCCSVWWTFVYIWIELSFVLFIDVLTEEEVTT